VETANVKVPILAKLILAELAERRGQPVELLLADLIRREAACELGALVSHIAEPTR
jgi:hypothetical protein